MATIHQIAGNFSLPVDGRGGDSRSSKLVVGPSSGGYETIQDAVNAAASGDTIFVQPGTYTENITVTTDYITIVGAQVGSYGWPDIVATAGGAALTVTAQGFVAKRCRFVTEDTDAVIQQGNGFRYEDCVFDGGNSEAVTEGLLRLKGNADDDSFTASEGKIVNCLFRGSAGFAVAFDTGDAPGNGVGSTHCVLEKCRFIDNTGADLQTLDTGGGVYSVQDVLIHDCYFAEPKNKATWIDFTTANGGAASDQTGMISNCYFNDDTVDTTAIAIVGTGVGVVGCHSMDGEFDGSGLD
jgi:hypothetical protein